MFERPSIEERILSKLGSGHWSIKLWTERIATPKHIPLEFEKLWLTHPDFLDFSMLEKTGWGSNKKKMQK
jgi:hypothetical protein